MQVKKGKGKGSDRDRNGLGVSVGSGSGAEAIETVDACRLQTAEAGNQNQITIIYSFIIQE